MVAKKKILIVSSDPVLLRFLQHNLSKDSYQITFAQHHDVDLKRTVEKEFPDLIILDIMMPNLEGIEVCLRLRQWSQAPMVMLSSWGAGAGEIRALDLGADSYLTEPFGAEIFAIRLDKVLRQDFNNVEHLLEISSRASLGGGNQ